MNDVILNENDLNDSSEENPNSKKAKTAKKRRLKKSTFIVTADNMESITLKTKDEFKDVINIFLLKKKNMNQFYNFRKICIFQKNQPVLNMKQ